jgi:hypothetical protein
MSPIFQHCQREGAAKRKTGNPDRIGWFCVCSLGGADAQVQNRNTASNPIIANGPQSATEAANKP